jgi:membrane fusion protein (multidrug efflux system)
MTRFLSIALVSAPLLFVAVSGCKPKGDGAADAGPAQEAVAVTKAPVVKRNVPAYLLATGQLRGEQEADVAANASGRVLSVDVERGAEVPKGAVLARLDTRAAALTAAEAAANVGTARVNATRAQADCARGRTLADAGAISDQEWERMEAACRAGSLGVAAAEARASMAAQMVGDGVLRAPFAGAVSERYIDVGEYVRPDSRIVTLVDVATLRLELTVPEAHLGKVTVGARALFSVAAFPGRTFEGKLQRIGASVRNATRDVLAEAKVDNADRALRPGMFAMVRLVTGEAPGVVVPKAALVSRDGKDRLYVVNQGRAEERVVALGDVLGDVVVITRGVDEGSEVVVSPEPTLRNGQAVK